jgi:hypothetical protein
VHASATEPVPLDAVAAAATATWTRLGPFYVFHG